MPGGADHHDIVRNVFGHNRVRADRSIIANPYPSDKSRPWAYIYIVAYDRRSFAFTSINLPYHHAKANVAVSPYFYMVTNDNVHDMSNIETAPDRRMMGNG